MCDFEEYDNDIMSSVHTEEITRSKLPSISMMQTPLSSGIATKRYSQDRISNDHGYKLIEMCKCFDVHVCNGRLAVISMLVTLHVKMRA